MGRYILDKKYSVVILDQREGRLLSLEALRKRMTRGNDDGECGYLYTELRPGASTSIVDFR